MLFDVQAALAEIMAADGCDSCDSCDSPAKESRKSQESQLERGEIPHPAKVLTFPPQPSPPAPSGLGGAASLGIADDALRALCSVTGRPVTWTGRVVPLDAWRRLSAWERLGPDGRLFCGICRAWVTAGAFPHCHAGGAA